MNYSLTQNWNKIVSPQDTVYHLGDFAFRGDLPYLEKLNGNIILIRGNHDKKRDRKLFPECYPFLELNVEPFRFILSHFPINHPRINQEIFKIIDPSCNQIFLHGHVHSSHGDYIGGQGIDVGVDAWNYRPVSLEQIIGKVRSFIGSKSREEG